MKMKSKNIVLIVTLVIVLLIVAGVVFLNVNVVGFLKSNLSKDALTIAKKKIQIVNDLCGVGALGVGISGFILYAKLSKDE